MSTNAAQWRNRIRAIVSTGEYDAVLVSLGSNDAQSASLRDQFDENVAELCAEVRASGARCVLLIPPNSAADRLPLPAGVELLRSPPVELAPDGIHLTPRGYAAWADHISASV
jgi:lysophospholipase L1-like esterase